MNRTIGVHPEFIRTALAQVYRVTRLTKELGIPVGRHLRSPWRSGRSARLVDHERVFVVS